MRIGIDARSLEGKRTGVGRYLQNLLREWQNAPFIDSSTEFILYFKERVPGDIEAHTRFKKRILGAPFRIQSNVLFTHVLLPLASLRDRIDLLFSPGYILPLWHRGKGIVTIHDIIYEARPELYSWPGAWDRLFLKFTGRIAAKKASLILVPSRFSANEIIHFYHVKETKIKVVYLGIDHEKFGTVSPDITRSTKRRYEISSDFIFFLGSIFNRRHIPECIEAFRRVANDFPDMQFLIAGENRTKPFVDIDTLCLELNQELKRPAIIRREFIPEDDLPTLYWAARILLWLSDYEGFGLPPLEAARCGTPVITARNGSIPEIMQDAAYYVDDPSDSEKIAKAIREVSTDETLRVQLKERGEGRARLFQWEKCARETWEYIKEYRFFH